VGSGGGDHCTKEVRGMYVLALCLLLTVEGESHFLVGRKPRNPFSLPEVRRVALWEAEKAKLRGRWDLRQSPWASGEIYVKAEKRDTGRAGVDGLKVYRWSTIEEGKKGRPFGWVPWSEKDGRAKFIWARGVAHSGERSLCIKGAKGRNFWVSASFPIDPEREYVFTAYVKGKGATSRNYIAIRFGGGGWWAKHASSWLWGGRFYEGIATLRSKSIEGTTEWIKLEVKATPPEGATWMTLLCCSEDNKGAVYFDDLLLVERLPKPLLFYPHIGFHPDGARSVLVGSEEDEGGGKFFLLDYSDHKVEGSVVFEGKLRRIESTKWLPYACEADFTNFRRPGIYRLLVRFRSGRGCLSRTFKIDCRIYDDVLKVVRNWFFVQRCGVEVPGWHKPCHLDDAVVRETRRGPNFGRVIKRVDARGGWHEGGGFSRHIGCVWLGVFPLAEAVELLDLPEEVKVELLEEAKWGADWLLKMQIPNGMFYDGVYLWEWRREKRTGEWRKASLPSPLPPERETDNIPGTEDDRVIPFIRTPSSHFLRPFGVRYVNHDEPPSPIGH